MNWYFDVISPFAWLALPEVEALGPSVAYRPVLFGGILKHWGQLGPAEIGPKRVHTYRLCVWEAEQRGVPLRFPPVHPFNPLRAMRLITALGAGPGVVRTAMEAIWVEGCDVSAPPGWARLVERLGVADADAVIEQSGAKLALRSATEAAVAAGVFGVPTLEVGSDLFWGVDAMPLARARIADAGLLSRGEMARVAGLEETQRAR